MKFRCTCPGSILTYYMSRISSRFGLLPYTMQQQALGLRSFKPFVITDCFVQPRRYIETITIALSVSAEGFRGLLFFMGAITQAVLRVVQLQQ